VAGPGVWASNRYDFEWEVLMEDRWVGLVKDVIERASNAGQLSLTDEMLYAILAQLNKISYQLEELTGMELQKP
jgi:hypothetical protein